MAHPDGTVVVVGMRGEAVIEYKTTPPDHPVYIEQSPDLQHWERYPVLEKVLLESTPEYKLWRETRQILVNPETGTNNKQFFRADY